MTTQDRSVLDQYLTGYSNMLTFEDSAYIAEKIMLPVPVAQTTGKLAGYGNAHLRIVNTATVGKGGYRLVDTENVQSDTYDITSHGIKDILTKEAMRNFVKPYDAEKDMTAFLTSVQKTAKEKALADTLTSTTIITQNTTLSGTDQYSDRANSDPIGDRATAVATIRANSGMIANTVIAAWEVIDALRYNEQFLEVLGFREFKPGGLTDADIAKALNVKNVLVGEAMYNAAEEGQDDDLQPIWGKDLIYAYIAPNLKLKQKTLGAEVRLNGTKPREIYKAAQDEPVGSKKIICHDNYDQLILNAECAYLIKDAIA